MSLPNVLIVSDDTEFVRALTGRWRQQKNAPMLTLVSSAVRHPAGSQTYALIILGPVRSGRPTAILRSFDPSPAVLLVGKPEENSPQPTSHPDLVFVRRGEEWAEVVILVANEVLRRVEALERARRAEQVAAASRRHAALGRYILEMRPSVDNALTSVLGNAELLLLEPGEQLAEQGREQVRTIHTMALRLNEILQRFSSFASELQLDGMDSQIETEAASRSGV